MSNTDEITWPAGVARAVFDIAVGSMDFSSGFLDDSEVASLREAAAALGVDPDVATPRTFLCRFRGRHRARPVTLSYIFTSWPDGLTRNQYSHRSGSLGIDRAPALGMFCPDCGRNWGPGGPQSGPCTEAAPSE